MQIRSAKLSDCQAISSIYNYYVETSTATFALEPETVAERQAWLNQHEQDDLPILVAELDNQVVAFASLSFYHQRCAYRQTVEASIYVDHLFLSRGYGRLLMKELMDVAESAGFHAVLGLICSENTASIKLMLDFGFFEAGCLKQVGKKYDRWLDVAILEKIL
ncbi:N-acetyltransferase [bacterium]|nr:N-acetyltransferase [bacterium]MBP9810686.1 N-acetyltransferase [bacterium]